MPEPEKPPENSGQAGAAEGAAGDPPKPPETPKPVTFASQEELDRIIEDRVRRARPTDYEEFKTKAAEYDKAKEAEKTELQKAEDARKAAEIAGATTLAKANERIKVAEIKIEALSQNADADIVAALLKGSEDITVEGDNVLGVKEAVKRLLKDKPRLINDGKPPRSGTEFGGNDQTSGAEKIAQLEREAQAATDPAVRRAKLAEARDLKMAAALVGFGT